MKGKKKIVISLFALLLWQGKANFILAQGYYPIPDANFANYLHTLVPSAMNGNLLDTTNAWVSDSIKKMTPELLNINSIDGVQFFKSLKILYCGGNNFTSIMKLPLSLRQLKCSNSKLTSISVLPSNLDTLICQSSSLTSLPLLPNSISFLHCYQNQISSVANFPSNCSWIDLSYNQITNVPNLPPQLVNLNLSVNKISNWPSIPNTTTLVMMGWNNMTEITNLPPQLAYLDTRNSPIKCILAKFPSTLIDYLWGDGYSSSIPICYQNYINALGGYTTVPLCEPGQCGPPTSIRIPNVFTPNGDGTNDEFFISSSDLSNFNCKIFDRWGRLVAELPNATSVWNGKDQSNKDCDSGTYFYVITYTDEGKRTIIKKGSVSLFR